MHCFSLPTVCPGIILKLSPSFGNYIKMVIFRERILNERGEEFKANYFLCGKKAWFVKITLWKWSFSIWHIGRVVPYARNGIACIVPSNFLRKLLFKTAFLLISNIDFLYLEHYIFYFGTLVWCFEDIISLYFLIDCLCIWMRNQTTSQGWKDSGLKLILAKLQCLSSVH